MSEVLPPKRQAAVDRLRRRIDLYAKDHQGRHLHYERIVPTLCEQQMHESFVLKQKYLDPKARSPARTRTAVQVLPVKVAAVAITVAVVAIRRLPPLNVKRRRKLTPATRSPTRSR